MSCMVQMILSNTFKTYFPPRRTATSMRIVWESVCGHLSSIRLFGMKRRKLYHHAHSYSPYLLLGNGWDSDRNFSLAFDVEHVTPFSRIVQSKCMKSKQKLNTYTHTVVHTYTIFIHFFLHFAHHIVSGVNSMIFRSLPVLLPSAVIARTRFSVHISKL